MIFENIVEIFIHGKNVLISKYRKLHLTSSATVVELHISVWSHSGILLTQGKAWVLRCFVHVRAFCSLEFHPESDRIIFFRSFAVFILIISALLVRSFLSLFVLLKSFLDLGQTRSLLKMLFCFAYLLGLDFNPLFACRERLLLIDFLNFLEAFRFKLIIHTLTEGLMHAVG